jgi:chromate transporter
MAVGLVLASGSLIAHSAAPGLIGVLLLLFTVAINLRTKLHPLWLILLGGVLGLMGLV